MTNPEQFNVPTYNPASSEAQSGPTLNDQIDGMMRGTAAVAGYGALGVNLLELPGNAAKVVGAAFIANALREQYAAINGGERTRQPVVVNLRERVRNLGQSLVGQSKGNSGVVAALQSQTGNEILNREDKEYRTKFARVMGGSAMVMSGVYFMSQPGTAEQVVGGVLAAVGLVEQTYSSIGGQKRSQELVEQRSAAETPTQKTQVF